MSPSRSFMFLFQIACITLLTGCLVIFADADDTAQEICNVKPGGEVHVCTKKANGITFKFTYACQGGTNEDWALQLEKLGAGQYRFSVSRPSGTSYLFFQQFRMEAEGAKVVEADAMSESSNRLDPKEYSIGKNSIEYVDGAFESHLAAVYIVVEKGKPEL